MDEEWRGVIGHADYEVSNLGRVRSVSRVQTTSNRWGPMARRLAARMLNPQPTGKGYLSVSLGRGNENRQYVHRLVAGAFIPAWLDTGEHVNHRNGDKRDNRSVNLEWVTPAENMLHASRVLGRAGGQFGPGRARYAAGMHRPV